MYRAFPGNLNTIRHFCSSAAAKSFKESHTILVILYHVGLKLIFSMTFKPFWSLKCCAGLGGGNLMNCTFGK